MTTKKNSGLPSVLRSCLLSLASWLVVSCMLMCTAKSAWAFCPARSCDPDADPSCLIDLTTGCTNLGVKLFRPNGCLAFGVQAGAAQNLGLSDAEFSGLVQAAYDLWSNVDCGNGKPALDVQTVGAVAATMPFTCNIAELNLDVWFLSTSLGGANSPLVGRTQPTFVLSNGKVLDADVVLNQDVLKSKQSDPEFLGLVSTVLRHEAGHVLGLAHSSKPDAIMFRSYPLTPYRELTQDDIDGVCALYPPNQSLSCSPPGFSEAALDASACAAVQSDVESSSSTSSGCSMASKRGPVSSAHATWLLAAWLASRVRRRR